MGVPNSSFYPQFVRLGKKNLIFSEIFPFFRESMDIWGTKLQFLSPSGQKNIIFSEIFPFLANKCTFGGTKLQFLSPSGQKNFIFCEIFPFWGINVHLGVPNSSFYPHRIKKTSFLVKFFHF